MSKPRKPRVLTGKEVRAELLAHIAAMAEYWTRVGKHQLHGGADEAQARADGLAFSILVALDGKSIGLPAFKLIPAPHPSDKQYCIDNGMDWYPSTGDIAGTLHEEYARVSKTVKEKNERNQRNRLYAG